jgi:hypothetical protein
MIKLGALATFSIEPLFVFTKNTSTYEQSGKRNATRSKLSLDFDISKTLDSKAMDYKEYLDFHVMYE